MKIELAKTGGFCWGVKRALDAALNIRAAGIVPLKRGGARSAKYKVFTYGPLIHNEQVVKMLKAKGIRPVSASAAGKSLKDSGRHIMVIRAHGAPPAVQDQLKKKGYRVIDATCPHVRHSQQQVKDYARKGYRIIIAGDKEHAEVFSLTGYANAASILSRPIVVSSKQEIRRLFAKSAQFQDGVPICLLAQSTFQPQAYQEIMEALKKRHQNVTVLNTICPAPTRRQREVMELSKRVDAMVVVGDHKSANTSRLAALSRSLKVPTFQVAYAKELPMAKINNYQLVGVTAGTSTPDWVIQAVIERLKKNK
jgi:4-hydroxy-3-methylbut-2-enyl diphosphate reductase